VYAQVCDVYTVTSWHSVQSKTKKWLLDLSNSETKLLYKR